MNFNILALVALALVSENSGDALLLTPTTSKASPTSSVSGSTQSTVSGQTDRSVSTSLPFSGILQSTTSGQGGSNQSVSLSTEINVNTGQSTQTSQQQQQQQQLGETSQQLVSLIQSSMPTSDLAAISGVPLPTNAPTSLQATLQTSISGVNVLSSSNIVSQRQSSDDVTQSTAPTVVFIQPQSSSVQQSSVIVTSPTSRATQQSPSVVVSQQQQQTTHPSSLAASHQSTLPPTGMSSFFSGNALQTTWQSQQPSSGVSSFLSTTPYPTFAPETPTHVQIMFGNNYTDSVGAGTNLTAYLNALLPYVATASGVTSDRITDMTVDRQPETGGVVLRFIIRPYPTYDCWLAAKCGITVQQAVQRLDSLVATTRSLRLPVVNSTDLTVANYGDDYKIFLSWTDNGPCPYKSCDSDTEICDCLLIGALYCRKVKNKPQLLYLLFLLLLIPLIIAVVVLVRCMLSRKKEQQQQAEEKKKNERRMVRADMLSYHEYVARDKEQVQPKLATVSTIVSRSTVNDSTLHSLYRSLGENVSIAFNGSTFVDINGTDNSDASSNDLILPNNNQ